MKNLQTLISDINRRILIISGEGEEGRQETYNGERTEKAIKQRLNYERCNGERFAKALVFSHENDFGNVYLNIETGECC